MTQMTSPLPNDPSRKRPRSASGSSSTSGISSPKRAASDSPAPAIFNKLVPGAQSTAAASSQDTEIDSYMQSQGEALTLTETIAIPPPAPPQPSLTPADKLRKIQELKTRPLKLGETWYIVSRTWYRNWESACGGAPAKGAPDDERQVTAVDNSPIAGPRPNKFNGIPLEEGLNIELLPQEAWELLVSWYGPPTHSFGRQVIAEGLNNTLRIEFYPINFYLYLCRMENPPPPHSYEYSKTTSLDTLTDTLIHPILLAQGNQNQPYRVWKVDPTSIPDIDADDEQQGYKPKKVLDHKGSHCWGSWNPILDPEKTTLEEAFISDGDRLILELQEAGEYQVQLPTPNMRSIGPMPGNNSPIGMPLYNLRSISQELVGLGPHQEGPLFGDGDFFQSMEAASSASSSPSAAAKRTEAAGKAPVTNSFSTSLSILRNKPQPIARVRGTTGLNNLGNTCFMSSALQCLAHLPELTEYFLNNVYQHEINPDNPLSTGGELARSYGALLQNLFDTSSSYSVAPRDFKLKISRHAPAFSGYAQHDSQELLAFLLDGLHEDLNRIRKKPYVENPDWEGGGDKEMVELARTFWTGYKKRNDSVIVDLFQGQYKSTLVCPECAKVSITFDPFMYLTLPLPVNKSWEHEVYFVTWDVARPNYKIRLSISRNSTFKDIKLLLKKWFDVDTENILAAEIFNNRIYKFFPDYHAVTDLLDGDTIFLYELPISSGQSPNAPKPSPLDPIILPVYTVTPSNPRYAPTYRFNTKPKDMIGYPFFVALAKEDCADEEKIYAALVDRYQQTTNLARDLYTWREEEEDELEEDDAVMVTAPQSEVSSDNGDPIVTEKNVEVEDDDEMEEVKLPTYSQSAPTGAQVVRGPPKSELFSWMVMQDNFDPTAHNTHGASFDTGRPANMNLRLRQYEADIDDTMPGVFRHGDGIVCEWDDGILSYYFGGNKSGGTQARWSETVDFVDPEMAAASASRFARHKSGITLDDCLNEFVKEEQLGEADLWYCPRCKKHQQATKKFDLWKVPDVLVVHLKRFSNSRMLRDKIDVLVNFPTEGLDLSDRVEERVVAKRLAEQGTPVEGLDVSELADPLLYDLFAVDEHMGGLGGGHYRAYAKNDDDEKWYHFDDARVDEATAKSSVTPYAYLLFYRRRTSQPIGGNTVELIEQARAAPPAPLPSPPPEPPLASGSKSTAIIPTRSVMLRPASPRFRAVNLDLAAADDTPGTSPRSSGPPSLQTQDELPDDHFGAGSAITSWPPGAFDLDGELDTHTGGNGIESWTPGATTPSPVLSEDEDFYHNAQDAPLVVNAGKRLAADEDYDDVGAHETLVQEIIVDEASQVVAAEEEEHGPHS